MHVRCLRCVAHQLQTQRSVSQRLETTLITHDASYWPPAESCITCLSVPAAGVGAATIDLSYRERLFYWIRSTFPNQNHTFHNGALAAAPSSYMSQCIHDFAPPHSDLVFVEVTNLNH